MRSEEKFDLEVTQFSGKAWIRVRFANGYTWVPSFRDLQRIIEAICECEDARYPPPLKGRQMVAEFLCDAVEGVSWPILQQRYKVPNREEV